MIKHQLNNKLLFGKDLPLCNEFAFKAKLPHLIYPCIYLIVVHFWRAYLVCKPNNLFENTHVSMESVIRMQLYLTGCHTLLQSTDNLALHAVAVLTSVLALDGVAVVINSSVGVTPEVSNKLLWRLFQKARSFCTLYSTFKTIGLLCKQYHIKLDSEIDTCLHSWRGWWSGASPSWFPRYTYTCNKKGFSWVLRLRKT